MSFSNLTSPRCSGDTNQSSAIVKHSENNHLKFVQLYTSKSYEDRKSMLLSPDAEGRDDETTEAGTVKSEAELKKHKLSPQLVNAISNTSQVLWANSQTNEGLLGRSDLPLQTAVGMPVAIDGNGNMCVVVMFSPQNLQNTDEAMEYLQFISRSATSSTIPCLLPVFDVGSNMRAPVLWSPTAAQADLFQPHNQKVLATSFGKGVTARFVSLDENAKTLRIEDSAGHDHDLNGAPQDCFGMPMLPSYAELGNYETEENPVVLTMDGEADVFDEASFGVWSTIMNNAFEDGIRAPNLVSHSPGDKGPFPTNMRNSSSSVSVASSSSSVVSAGKPFLHPNQKERLEEFSSAFLGMSIFDAADAWIPNGGTAADELCHVTSVVSTKTNEALTRFAVVSQNVVIKPWSGAVGRAFASGNPVWSANREVIVDSERSGIFDNASIRTALAIPIFSDQSEVPACVVCYYSILRTDAVPVVLRFLQQALRLLWDGLEKIEPHESVGKELWREVAPADLGEMAADLEMQQEFLRKKRPREMMSPTEKPHRLETSRDRSSSLSLQLQSLNLPNQNVPFQSQIVWTEERTVSATAVAEPPIADGTVRTPTQNQQTPVPSTSVPIQQQDSVRYVETTIPWNTNQHVSTNAEGSKRAHIGGHVYSNPPQMIAPAPQPQPITAQAEYETNNMQFQQTMVMQGGQVQMQPVMQPQQTSQPSYQPTPQQSTSYQQQQPPSYQQQQSASYQQQQPASHQDQLQNFSYQGQQQSVSYQSQQQPISFLDQQQTIYVQQPQPLAQPHPLQMPQGLANPFVSNSSGPSTQTSVAMEFSNHMSDVQNNVQYQSMPLPTPIGSPHAAQARAPVSFSNAAVAVPYQIQSNSGIMAQQEHSYNGLFKVNAPVQGSMLFLQAPSPTPIAAGAPSGEFHLPPGMAMGVIHIPLGESCKSCRIQGCDDPAVSRRPYCAKHSGNRLCENPECDKCAQGSTRFCIAHGGGRRCTHPGCDKGARDRYFCAAHGGGKRCQHPTCSKSAVGGSSLCTSHGGGRRCAVEGCDKSAQSSTKFCVKHGGGKKCEHDGCEKVARGRTYYCAAHGGGIRCKLEGCNRVAIGKLQLCRAHGGGSNRSRSGGDQSPPSDSEPFIGTSPPLMSHISGVHNI
jgi:hypothetical protein